MFNTIRLLNNKHKIKVMKKLLFVALLVLFSFSISYAQKSYNTGLGLRGGFTNGITLKHFVSNNAAVEGILSTRWRGFNITGLYEINKVAFDTPGLYWFYGVGGHIGFWGDYDGNPWFEDNDSHTVIGIDGILGMEYVFAEIPFSIGIDWKPAINVIGHSGLWADGGALSIRYIW